jgi:hypothetical protein
MIHSGLKQWEVFGEHVASAMIEAAVARTRELLRAGLREVSAIDVFLTEGKSARAGFPLSCGRLPVALRGEVCLISAQQWGLYVSEFAELQAAL